eukprot:11158807-Lingulodinium_polyedra.AAC.1
MAGVAAWIAQHDAQHGFRPPALAERARATGAAAYLESLRLQGRAFYDAMEDFFDRSVVPIRFARP